MRISPIINSNISFGSKNSIAIIPSSRPTKLEENIERKLKVNPTSTVVKKFANGETYVNIRDDVRNKDVYLMPTLGKEVNDNLMEMYLKADASKRMGANKVVAVLPNFPYSRQERKTEPGEPISAKLNLSLLHASGIDEVITSDLHAPSLQGFPDKMNITEISSLNSMAKYIKSKNLDRNNLVVVSPDIGGAKRADKLSKELDCEKAVIYKHRSEHNKSEAETLFGNVEGKDCIIYDDIIDTAGTISNAVKLLKDNKANRIYVCASHGLFNGDAIDKLKKCPIEEIIVTNDEFKPNYNKVRQIDISNEIVGAILDISG